MGGKFWRAGRLRGCLGVLLVLVSCPPAPPAPQKISGIFLLLSPWPAIFFQCCGATLMPTPRLAVSLCWEKGIVFCVSKCYWEQIKRSGCARETMTCFICADKSNVPFAKVWRFPVVTSLWLSLYSKGECWSYSVCFLNVHNWKY